jgi:predicted dehydrogenase
VIVPASATIGGALTSALAVGAYASGDETIKLALVGCGGRGTGAACQALRTKGPMKLWAMADLSADRLENCLAGLTQGQAQDYDREAHRGFGERIDVPPERRFVGFNAYQRAIQSGVDLVILATPPHFRPEHYEFAVQQGKHVFMEKPVAVDAPGIRRVLAANEEAKRKGLKVVVGLHRRHSLVYQETVRRVQEGAIGKIVLMRCYWNRAAIPVVPPQANFTVMQKQVRNWPCFTWLGGDHCVEAHVHNLDICYWIKGAHPTIAKGQGGRQVHTGGQYGNINDHHAVEYDYEDGTKLFGQARSISGCWNHVSEQAHGTKGAADIGNGRIEGAAPWRFRGAVPNPYQVEHDVLVDAIRNDKPHNEAEYAAIATMTAILGRMASYSGQRVRWDEAIHSPLRLGPKQYAFDADPPVVPDAQGIYPSAMPGVSRAF